MRSPVSNMLESFSSFTGWNIQRCWLAREFILVRSTLLVGA
jgi:hypothetical protein